MTKQEFLDKLQESLENDLETQDVYENMRYYRSYIDDEISGGRSETDVLDELGDPWVIAQSAINMSENTLTPNPDDAYTYGGGNSSREERYDRSGGYDRDGGPYGGNFKMYQIDTWWKKLLVVLVIVAILCIIFAVVGGIMTVLGPILMPVLLILMVYRIFLRRRW